MTKGERLVRVDFNVSGNPEVDRIKTEAAWLIDRIEAPPVPAGDTGRHGRRGRGHVGSALRGNSN